jgi:hypothetical protein
VSETDSIITFEEPLAVSDDKPISANDVIESNEIKSYTFDIENDITATELPKVQPRTIELPGTSYIFNPIFGDDDVDIRSDNIYVTNDMFALIFRSNGKADCLLRIYRINANSDELIYDDDSSQGDCSNLTIRFLKGETYYFTARPSNGAPRANIYINAK